MIKLLFLIAFLVLGAFPAIQHVATELAEETAVPEGTVHEELKKVQIPLKTDDEVVEREERAMSSEGYSIEEQRQMRDTAQRYQFQSDVSRVMHIIINSIYSNKEIFIRELISNASDAIDKIRFQSLTNPSLLGEGDTAKLEIFVHPDPEKNILTIRDRGIGMTKEDLISKLGTIAKSGTREFIEAMKTGDMNLIGQFGVGFYSGFLVADKITVHSKHNDDPTQWVWESTADSSFSVTADPKGNTLGRGTSIVLHLKEEASEYSKPETIKKLIKRYSEFINFPIYLWETEEVETDTEEPTTDESEEVFMDDESKESKDETTTTTTTKESISGWKLQNELKPIWMRNPNEVTEEEYNKFYKSFSREVEDPITYLHFVGEGEIEFRAILFIPGSAPFGMFEPESEAKHKGLRLYVKRVFITDNFNEMFPTYLNFIKGMVDSENLPLNVSREILQQDRTMSLIKKKLTRKVIGMLQDLAENEEKFNKFYEKYAINLKYGVAQDAQNRARLSKLLRFHSSKTGKLTSFDEYVSRMKDGQTDIYYLAGESLDALQNSPFVERLLKKGYEILYMTEAIDEWCISNIPRYDNKYSLVNASKEGLKLEEDKQQSEEKKEKDKALKEEFATLLTYLKDTIGTDKISKASISTNLVRAPSAITAGLGGYTANMERLMKAQAFADTKQFSYMRSQRILEINPRHPIIQKLNSLVKEDSTNPLCKDLAILMYDTASLHSGFSVDDPAGFASRIHNMMKLSLQLDLNAPVEEEEEEEEVVQSTKDTSYEEKLENFENFAHDDEEVI